MGDGGEGGGDSTRDGRVSDGDGGGIGDGNGGIGDSGDGKNRDVRRVDRRVGAIIFHRNGRKTRRGRQRRQD